MKALVIPANSSEPVTEIEFYQDESWRYVLTRYNDPDEPAYDLTEVAFFTKENAQRDYLLRNSRASEYLKNHSEGFDSAESLYGDVVVVGYDDVLEQPTDLPWPHSPEDFEDLLTKIVDPPQRVMTPEEIDEGVVRTDGVWDDLGELDDDGDPTQRNRAVAVRALSMDPNHAKAVIEEYEAKRYLEAESDRHPDRPERRRASR
jgi:hypothetical protein